ncbi:unnamed protein product [Linum tenue]|uniref:Uncharacterized protein n=1 Tax=Linum tenue TaxID=586396 RepID=A0AAV0NQR9_9ROSI|nr:unnamed protein product [Linum tenue]
MVVALRPANFYGSSLPRPRFFDHTNDVTERVDPPVSVMDPLLSWAQEAHWSMGDLNTQRFRLQGRIEGNVDRLRKFREKQAKSQTGNTPKKQQNDVLPLAAGEKNHKRAGSTSPPPAPRVMKKRKFMDLFGNESESEENEQMGASDKSEGTRGKKWPVRKLVGEFERVAMETEAKKNEGKTQESVESVGVRTRRSGSEKGNGRAGDSVMKIVEELNKEGSARKNSKKRLRKVGEDGQKIPADAGGNGGSVRTSPRFAKLKSS